MFYQLYLELLTHPSDAQFVAWVWHTSGMAAYLFTHPVLLHLIRALISSWYS